MSGLDEVVRARQALEAATLHREGRSVADVASALSMPRRTAGRRIRAGEALLARLERAQAAAAPGVVYRLTAARLRS